MVEISASILDAKEDEAAKIFYNLEVAKIDYFHIDVMDGKFVEKNTVDKMNQYSNILKQITILPLDVHLMVEDHWFLPDILELSLHGRHVLRPFPPLPPPLPLLNLPE